MFRLINKFHFQPFSKYIEPIKKAKLPQKSKDRQVALQRQRINKIYLQFQATRTDPLSLIKMRFIRKKKLLSNRRVYMPNKRQYLLQLDRYMKEIEQKHEQQLVRDSYITPKTIGQKIAQQLEHEKVRFFFNMFREDKWVIRISSSLLFLLAGYEVLCCSLP